MSEVSYIIVESPLEVKRRKNREKMRRYRASYPDKIKEYKRREWHRHKCKIQERLKEWKARNPEKVRKWAKLYQAKPQSKQLRKEWVARNRDMLNEKARARYLINKDHVKKRRYAYQREYAIKNKEALARKNREFMQTERGKSCNRQRQSVRRAKIKGCELRASSKDIFDFLSKSEKCSYCGALFSNNLPATLDHKIPLSKKGNHCVSNFAAACLSCNSQKHAKTPEEFAAYRLQIASRRSS